MKFFFRALLSGVCHKRKVKKAKRTKLHAALRKAKRATTRPQSRSSRTGPAWRLHATGVAWSSRLFSSIAAPATGCWEARRMHSISRYVNGRPGVRTARPVASRRCAFWSRLDEIADASDGCSMSPSNPRRGFDTRVSRDTSEPLSVLEPFSMMGRDMSHG